jgi:hypothetical protein
MPRQNPDPKKPNETTREQQNEQERPEVRQDGESTLEPGEEDHAATRERGGRYGDGWW